MAAAPIEPFAKDQLTLSQAARRLPKLRGDHPVSPSTLWRWYRHGLRACDGTVVRLEVWRVGGQTFTSEDALRRFFARLGPARRESEPENGAPAQPTTGRGATEDELDALGIK
jgi:hypothetical protein